jgi:hypothetical protein
MSIEEACGEEIGALDCKYFSGPDDLPERALTAAMEPTLEKDDRAACEGGWPYANMAAEWFRDRSSFAMDRQTLMCWEEGRSARPWALAVHRAL